MQSFANLKLDDELVKSLTLLKIEQPTPIQAAAIPIALAGDDIFGSAQTGSGKTFAYSIPLIMHLINTPGSHALVITPTRELAAQVRNAIHTLMGPQLLMKSALLIGGEPMPKQFAQLRKDTRIIVGTPGRIRDHLTRGSIKLNKTSFFVVDEADRMLDMGFGVQLEYIADRLPNERQTLMFSATVPHNITRLAEKYLKNPQRVSVDSTSQPGANIKQEMIHTTASDKFGHLLKELNEREGSVIVFVKTKRGAEQLVDKLLRQNQSADAIHGDLRQRQRDQVIQAFRVNKHRIMVATDVAARGLDIPHIRHVINYDLPQCAEDYIHRIGRTARAGTEGSALCMVAPEDASKWKLIYRLINPNAKPEKTDGARRPRRGPPSFKPRSEGSYGEPRARKSYAEDTPRSGGGYRGQPRAEAAYAGEGQKAGGYAGRPRSGGYAADGQRAGGGYAGRPRAAGEGQRAGGGYAGRARAAGEGQRAGAGYAGRPKIGGTYAAGRPKPSVSFAGKRRNEGRREDR